MGLNEKETMPQSRIDSNGQFLYPGDLDDWDLDDPYCPSKKTLVKWFYGSTPLLRIPEELSQDPMINFDTPPSDLLYILKIKRHRTTWEFISETMIEFIQDGHQRVLWEKKVWTN